MTVLEPLQSTTLGAGAGLLFFAGAVLSIVVGLFVGYRAVRAYRRTERRDLLLFGVGLLLLVAVSKLANVVLSSTLPTTVVVGPVTELLRLSGALVVTYAIYDR